MVSNMLNIPEHITIGALRHRITPNYLLILLTYGKMVKNTFLIVFSEPEIVFSLCFVC